MNSIWQDYLREQGAKIQDGIVQYFGSGQGELAAAQDGKALIEPDLRAIYNPKRMKVIENAATNLLIKIKSLCPECSWPGFEIVEWIKGLPCANCSLPTKQTLKHIYLCKKCQHKKEIQYPDGETFCEPTFCDFCNP